MRISKDTINYLDGIAKRVSMYNKCRRKAINFIEENEIADKVIATNCVIMSLMWAAGVRGEQLTEQEMFLYLGVDEDKADRKIMHLDPIIAEMSLEEVLDYVASNT